MLPTQAETISEEETERRSTVVWIKLGRDGVAANGPEPIVRDDYQDGVSTVISSGRDTQDTSRPATVEHFYSRDLKGALANTPYKSETQYPRSSVEPLGKGDAS